MPLSRSEFVRLVTTLELCTSQDIDAISQATPDHLPPKSAADLADDLIANGVLTNFQVERILAGQGEQLLLGNYLILDKLGEGGMGMVLKARHRRLQRMVALKVLAPAISQKPEAVARFQREVEAAARLSHRHIVETYDADDADGKHFMVMQFIDGVDLAKVVRKNGRASVSQAVDYVVQAASGLHYAHEVGVIHRDIKPSNLILDQNGVVRILDMGLARLEDEGARGELTSTGQVMGTVDYMSPEQALDTHTVDARSDIYSLGATLWFLLTGRPMFRTKSMVKTLLAHQNEPRPSLREAGVPVTPEFEQAFQRLTAINPDERPATMNEVMECLTASAGDLGGGGAGDAAPASAGYEETVAWQSYAEDSATDGKPDTGLQNFIHDMQADESPDSPESDPPRLIKQSSGATPVLIGALVVISCLGLLLFVAFRGGQRPADEPRKEKVTKAKPKGPAGLAFPAQRGDVTSVQQAWAKHLGTEVQLEVSLPAGETLRLRLIPPGTFMMGTSRKDLMNILKLVDETGEGWEAEHFLTEMPQHKVTLTRPFFLGVYEVTNAQFADFAKSTNLSWNRRAEDQPAHPATDMTYGMMDDFCEWLTKTTGYRFRLPTEAEWEYGCRSGTDTHFAFGDSLSSDLANFNGRYPFGNESEGENRDRPAKVGSFLPNAFGLHDMHGNVWEVCADGWNREFYRKSPKVNPKAIDFGGLRVHRSGDYEQSRGYSVRSAVRHSYPLPYPTVGFRVVCEVSQE